MRQQVVDVIEPSLKKAYPVSVQKPRSYLRRVNEALMANVNSLSKKLGTQKTSGRLYKFKIKHQILLLTTVLIILVAIMLFIVNQLYLTMFRSMMAEGYNSILRQQNANFQASIMVKYMLITSSYFYNDQQLLKSINKIYNYALESEYSIDLRVECSLPDQSGEYSTIQQNDQFCFISLAQANQQTLENDTLNLEFIKFTSLLNQFMNNALQIKLNNQNQMISFNTKNGPFLQFTSFSDSLETQQESQDEINPNQISPTSNYFQQVINDQQTLYLTSIQQTLSNGSESQGAATLTIQFSVFEQLLQKFPDVNLGLIALDGTLLFEQRQVIIADDYQFIYDQVSTGYNYLDWVKLSSHEDYTKQLVINNTLFQEAIHVNVKKFNELPYYFIVYNNLTYENQISEIQAQIIHKIRNQNDTTLVVYFILLLIILIVCYLVINLILKPLLMIHRLINFNEYNLKYFQILQHGRQSNNILYIMSLMIYLKYSQFQNLSFHKSLQCQVIEDIQFPMKQNSKGEKVLIKYLPLYQRQIVDNYLIVSTDREFMDSSELYAFPLS